MEVLFICTGNTCRSPMAEVIFNETYKNAHAESRGLFVQRGSKMTHNTKEILNREYGYAKNREAEQVRETDVVNAEYIITMTDAQKNEITRQYGHERVYTLRELAGETGDVDDPYGKDIEIYADTFSEIRRLIQKIDNFEKYRR